MTDNYQWVGWGLSCVIITIIVLNQWGLPAILRIRMKLCPYTLHFRKDIKSGGVTSELRVPANSCVTIHLQQTTKTKHFEHTARLGFHGPAADRPEIVEYQNDFVKRGLVGRSNPDEYESDWVDANNRYFKKTEKQKFRGKNTLFGYVLKTKGAGEFPLNFATVTEVGEAKPCNKLTLIVEAPEEN